MGLKNKIRSIKNKFFSKNVKLDYNYLEYGKLLNDKNAIVFGGATGIGLAISNQLYDAGAKVIVCSRTKHNLDSKFDFYPIDLEKDNFIDDLDKLIKKYGKIDVVINCQGICPGVDFKQDYMSIDMKDFNSVININLRSVYFINQYFCNYYIKNKIAGNILNIASTEGLKGSIVPYGISKSGVVSITKGFGKKMAPYNITVNGIAPGATATSMMKIKDNNLNYNYIPSKRMSTPNEISNMALFLVSDMGKNMTGEVVVIDGGESLL